MPLAVAAWAAAWTGTSGRDSWLLAVALVAILVIAVALVGRSVHIGAVAAVMLIVLAGAALRADAVRRGPVPDLAAARASARAELRLTADPKPHPARGPLPPYLTQRAEVRKLTAHGRTWQLRTPVLVVVTGNARNVWAGWPVGATVDAPVRLRVTKPGDDVAALLQVQGKPNLIRPPPAGLRLVERVRVGLRDAVAHRAPEQRALVPALVLGDTSALDASTIDDFKTTGLSHLTAVSGANLSLLLAFLLLGARWAGVRGWALRAVGLVGVVVFVALCRTEPSVLRAAAMGLVILAALGTGAKAAGLRNLSVASFGLLLVDPWLARSVGFSLSVLASAGIIGWARTWAVRLGRWLPGPIAEAVAVPLAAHLTTLPVVAAISGRVSVVGLWVNALAGPFVGPATVLGFAAAGLSLLSPPLAALAGFGAAWSTQPILWCARFGARLPGASWGWPTTPSALVLLAGLAVTIGLLIPRILGSRWLTLGLSTLLLVGLLRSPVQPGWPPAGWVLVACDVGQGDGLVMRVDDHRAAVIDVGPDPQAMDYCLARLRVRQVPVLVLTHFHADHVGGLQAVLRDHQVGRILTASLPSPWSEAARVQQLAASAGVPVARPHPGDTLAVGELRWSTLGPVGTPNEADSQSSVENDASVVGLVEVAGVRVLLTGDAEPDAQAALLRSGADLRADVLKVPHHGSARQDRAFFAATGAQIAVVSAGLDNGYGHPAPSTVALVRSLGMTLLRTDTEGSVAVVRRGSGLGATVQRRPPP